MKRLREEEIGKVIARAMQQEGLDTALMEREAIEIWRELTARWIDPAQADPLARVQQGVIRTRVGSASLRQELTMHSTLIIEEINRRLGAEIITGVKFR